MDHEKIRNIFSEMYNGFYLTNRKEGTKRTEEEWEMLLKQGQEYIDKYREPIVNHIVEDLLYYFEKQENSF